MTDIPAVAGTLVLEGVGFDIGSRRILDEVSLSPPPGRVTSLVGPSGCGKTTLLRIVAGIAEPMRGRVLLDGQEIAGASRFVPPERRRVGLMFQDYALFPHLTVLDNVLFGLGHLPRARRRAVADEALAAVNLTAHAGKRPGQLSGGEQQRVALARALAPAPRVLLMDEPFSNLDRTLRESVRAGTLAVLREAGITAVVVTHDPEEALAIADHVVLLGGGRVIQAGSGGEVYRHPVSLAAARALSWLNEVPGRFERGALDTPLGRVAVTPPAGAGEGAAGILCLRPEDIAIGNPGTGVPGRIVGRSFRGASNVWAVAVEGLPEPLRVSARDDDGREGNGAVSVAMIRSTPIAFTREEL